MMLSLRARLSSLLLLVGRLILAAIFLWAAYGKLRPVESAPWTLASLRISGVSLNISQMLFATQVDSYQILPSWAVLFVARTLPWLELAVGILLVSGLLLRWVGLLTSVLLTVLLVILARTYAAGLQINCGCFGPGAEPLTGGRLFLEVLFLALAVAVTIGAFLRARSRRKLEHESAVDFV